MMTQSPVPPCGASLKEFVILTSNETTDDARPPAAPAIPYHTEIAPIENPITQKEDHYVVESLFTTRCVTSTTPIHNWVTNFIGSLVMASSGRNTYGNQRRTYPAEISCIIIAGKMKHKTPSTPPYASDLWAKEGATKNLFPGRTQTEHSPLAHTKSEGIIHSDCCSLLVLPQPFIEATHLRSEKTMQFFLAVGEEALVHSRLAEELDHNLR